MKKPRSFLPFIITALAAIALLLPLRPPSDRTDYNLRDFRRLPVSADGRTKPVDTVARNALLVLNGRERLKVDGSTIDPTVWLLNVIARPEVAHDYPVFRVDHPDVRALLKLNDNPRQRVSFRAILNHRDQLFTELQAAAAVDRKERDAYQSQLVELGKRLQLYNRLIGMERPFVVAPLESDTEWMPMPEAMRQFEASGQVRVAATRWVGMLEAWRAQDPVRFNQEVAAYTTSLKSGLPDAVSRADTEVVFNRYQPFYIGMVMYVIVFLVAIAGFWLFAFARRESYRTVVLTAALLLGLTFVLHTTGLTVRMILQGRPPVTNLYSSAVFVGWGAVLVCLALEYLFRLGIGSLVGAMVGFCTLLIAHHLAKTGDTLEMMQAVLDTNFWLATHVTAISIGYVATFVAGGLGILYIFLGVLTSGLTRDLHRAIGRMIYGTIAFALLFSFVGTVLGGIWADQSWGRFWGWDPKENGAVLIVLMNALILHARWGGMVQQRGMAVLAVGGNIITTWSWFGTNQLGIGLHSYGFMDSAVFWLLAFVVSQLLIMAVGLLPRDTWRSRLQD